MTYDRDNARALIARVKAYPSDVMQWDEPGLAGDVIAELTSALEAALSAVPVEGDPLADLRARLDEMNAMGRISYEDYSELHDLAHLPLPVEGEVEWEYGCRSGVHRQPVVLDPMLDKPEDHEWDCPSPAIVRRRKAGPWQVAP